MIRELRDEDTGHVAEIICSLPLWQRYGMTAELAAATVARALALPDSEWIVAEQDSVILGFAWMLHKGCFGMSGYLKMLGVREASQGRGVGTALLRAAEDAMFARGPNAFLLVSHFNSRAIAFYEARDYERVGVIRSYVLEGVDEIMVPKNQRPRHAVFAGGLVHLR